MSAKRDIEDMYPLAPVQQGMLFHALEEPESGIYLTQVSYELHGPLEGAALEQAWQRVLERHPVLRSAFVWDRRDEPFQVVFRRPSMPWTVEDWRQRPAPEHEERLEEFLRSDRERGLELAKAPLLRLTLIRQGEEHHRLVWTHHHILLDGWSTSLVLREVLELYGSLAEGLRAPLPPARPYRDFVRWLGERDPARAAAFWLRQLEGFEEPTPLGQRSAADAVRLDRSFDQRIELLAPADSTALSQFGREHHLTLNTLVQAAWALVLARYAGQGNVVFGVTVSGRPPELPGVETMVGLFINTLPLRVQVRPGERLSTWLEELQELAAEVRQYEHTPLATVRAATALPASQPLFESIVNFLNFPVDESLRHGVGTLNLGEVRFSGYTNYPLVLVATPAPGDCLSLRISHELRRFDRTAAARALAHVRRVLRIFASGLEGRLGELSVLTPSENHQLLVEWNRPSVAPRVGGETLGELFERAVELRGEALAVIAEDGEISYRELDQRSNRLARHLHSLEVTPDQPVAICLERGLDWPVAMLAVLKAGGAFLPLEPGHPAQRLSWVAREAGVRLLIARGEAAQYLAGEVEHTIDPGDRMLETLSDDRLVGKARPENLAYVIFTSGSTGRPKGVAVEHRQIVSYLTAVRARLGVAAEASFASVSTLAADLGHTAVFPALCAGGCLHLISAAHATDAVALAEHMRRFPVDVLKIVPSHLAALQAGPQPEAVLPCQHLVLGGEAFRREDAERLEGLAPACRLWNHYGPTETTVGVLMHSLASIPESTTVPLGRPLAGYRAHVLDHALRPVPIGVSGELVIAGAGVARGYLGRPSASAERFVPDPDAAFSGARLYRTGDLVRYTSAGRIEFLGRIDHQVKIRGFRVEPEEVEAALRRDPAVGEAVVVARVDGGETRLVGYFVAAGGVAGSQADVEDRLRRRLAAELPAAMVPAILMALEELPLTPNGKLDRRALPEPGAALVEVAASGAEPRSPVEEILAAIWTEVLGRERVGREENWFDLGGHSLEAMRLVGRARRAFRVDLPLGELFKAPTVAAFAARIESAREGVSLPSIEPVARHRELPLSFAQERLWFLDQLEPESSAYNSVSAFRLVGELDVSALGAALTALSRRHEVLRTSFPAALGRPVQHIAGPHASRVSLPLVDLSRLATVACEAEAQRLTRVAAKQFFDLERGPLLSASLLRFGGGEHLGVLALHHIATDAWSSAIAMREVAAFYGAALADDLDPLDEMPLQYADYAHWQRSWLTGEVLEQHLAYWRRRLAGELPQLKLPVDGASRGGRRLGARDSFTLSHPLRDAVEELARRQRLTPFMVLLAAFGAMLGRTCGCEEVLVGTAVTGRNRVETEGLIGFFVNMLPMRVDLSGSPRFRELLARVREVTLGAYAHQEMPFDKLVEELRPERARSGSPLFQVAFSLDNLPSESLRLPRLELEPVELPAETVRFDLTVWVREVAGDGFVVYWTYDTELFRSSTIARLHGRFEAILASALKRPELPLAALEMESGDDRERRRGVGARQLKGVRRKAISIPAGTTDKPG